jgi:hypothetical protein
MNGRAELLDPSTAVRAAVLADPRVRSVELIGSRATGTATELPAAKGSGFSCGDRCPPAAGSPPAPW